MTNGNSVSKAGGRPAVGGRRALLGVPKFLYPMGRMAELADALALGASGDTLGGSNPLPPTRKFEYLLFEKVVGFEGSPDKYDE